MEKSDLLIERSKLLSKITKWKIAFLVAAFIGILGISNKSTTTKISQGSKPSGEFIGIIKLENEIIDDPKFDELLDSITKDKSIKALIVDINSPGGSSGASEKIYNKLLEIKKNIPIVANIGSLGASGGYLVALAAERIYALNMSITGSIGVVVQTAEIIELADKLGIKFKNYKSSPLKASPNPFEPATKEAEDAIMDVVNDSHDFFVTLVSENRKIPLNEAKKLADGRIYSGRQAAKLKLVDAIGTISDSEEWLKKEKKISNKAKLKLLEPKKHNDLLEILLENLEQSSKVLFENLKIKLVSRF